MWSRFQKDFQRVYLLEEEPNKFAAFKKNVLQAYEMNAEQGINCTCLFDDEQCVFGITKFSDMFADEFAATHLGYKPGDGRSDVPVLSTDDLPTAPDSVDWREKGAVTAVKDQGQCGSCWAFSTTESIESAVFMSTKKLPTLSTQQIISCDKGEDEGCNGGDTVTAYKYVEKAGGLDTASDYPDKSHKSGKTGKCTWDKKKSAKVTGFTFATKQCTRGACKNQDENAVATAMAAKGPISVCLNAAASGWQNYKRGVFSKTCSSAASKMDHCVQIVGYDKSGATPYWILRNSWNTDWGIKGYMHLKMGTNMCGVANEATIATATAEVSEIAV
jgi:C1A family cysteine protease